ncbi:MAG: tetratricopeptide repeat protein [Alphaproteobacteria bacterium]|nr:tetratricopeptide repeat protein [Alphaproteobacteria bacterium]
MMRERRWHLRYRRPITIAGVALLALAVALLLGRWLAVVQAPLTRHAVARSLLESGAPDKAAHVFEEPIWQGVALYRAERYHRSVGAFVTDDSITGLYNMGNAYVRLGLYRGAIAAYEAVLQRRPNHEDARFNLELVRAADKRKQELEDESRETENAGNWEDGLRDSQEQGESKTANSDPADNSESGDSSDPPEEDIGEQDDDIGAGETAAPESQVAGENAGGSEREGEQADASVFSLSGRDDQEADDLSQEGGTPEDAEVIGGVIDRAREEAMADEILLRRIVDDPAVVLKARLNMALRRQKAAP